MRTCPSCGDPIFDQDHVTVAREYGPDAPGCITCADDEDSARQEGITVEEIRARKKEADAHYEAFLASMSPDERQEHDDTTQARREQRRAEDEQRKAEFLRARAAERASQWEANPDGLSGRVVRGYRH